MTERLGSEFWAAASDAPWRLIAFIVLAVGFGFSTMAIADEKGLTSGFDALDVVNPQELEQHRGREGSEMSGLTQVNLSNTQDFDATIENSTIQADSIVNGSISFGDQGAGTFAGPTIILNNTGNLNNFNIGQAITVNLQ